MKFLNAEEVQLDYIKRGDINSSETAIKVRNGSFYWLTDEEKRIKKEKQKEEEMTPKEKKKYEKEKKKEEKKKKKEEKQRLKDEKKKKISQSQTMNIDSIIISTSNQPLLDGQNQTNSSENSLTRFVVEDVNLEMKRGSFVAILGE